MSKEDRIFWLKVVVVTALVILSIWGKDLPAGIAFLAGLV